MNAHMRLAVLMVLVVNGANAMKVEIGELSFEDVFECRHSYSLTPITSLQPTKSASLTDPKQYNDFLKNKTQPLAIPGRESLIPSSDTQEVMPRRIVCSLPERTILQLLIENQCRTGILDIEGIKHFLDNNPKENVSDTARDGNNLLHAIVKEAGRIVNEVMTNRLNPERSKKLLIDLISITQTLRERNICRVATNKIGCTAKAMADSLFTELMYCEEAKPFLEEIKELIDPKKAKE